MRISKLAKLGPIFLLIWLIGYLVWAYYIPLKWDAVIREFSNKDQLNLDIYRMLGFDLNLAVGASLVEAATVFGVVLIVTFAIGFVLDLNWFKRRTFRDLFS